MRRLQPQFTAIFVPRQLVQFFRIIGKRHYDGSLFVVVKILKHASFNFYFRSYSGVVE